MKTYQKLLIAIGVISAGLMPGAVNNSYYPPRGKTEQPAIERTRLYTSFYWGIGANNKNLENGFIDPTKIVVEQIDEDKNGKYEVILDYKGNRYLMREYESGKVCLEWILTRR